MGEIDTLLAQKADVVDLNATNANVAALQAADARIEHLVAEKAAITDLNATNATVTSLQAATGNIESLLAGNAGVGTLQAIHLTGDNIVIEDATIAQAVMDDLMAGNVTAATIYTDFIKIGSQDGALSIDGATILIKDSNNTPRVQIGKDGQGNFNYYLWDASGNLIWSPEGITADGVPDGLIVDSMVANDAAIDGSKLNIRSVARELTDDGTLSVDASRVVMNETTLEATYETMNTQIGENTQATQTLQTQVREVQGQITQKVWQSDITSKADGSTVQSLTARVNTVEETADGVTRTVSQISTQIQGTVTDVAVFYALNNSETVPPPDNDPGWSLEAPEWVDGMYMWQKTVTTYASGNTRTSSPTCLSGAIGADGEAAVLRIPV